MRLLPLDSSRSAVSKMAMGDGPQHPPYGTRPSGGSVDVLASKHLDPCY
jgi:hypothetical protein